MPLFGFWAAQDIVLLIAHGLPKDTNVLGVVKHRAAAYLIGQAVLRVKALAPRTLNDRDLHFLFGALTRSVVFEDAPTPMMYLRSTDLLDLPSGETLSAISAIITTRGNLLSIFSRAVSTGLFAVGDVAGFDSDAVCVLVVSVWSPFP